MERYDAIVIGAGPAGMMAALGAAERNKKVLLIEQNETPGKKLLISGNGRCNLTNTADIGIFIEQFSSSRDFLRNAFAQFFTSDLIAFFEDSGVALKVEENGRVLPQSDKAGDILDVLRARLRGAHVEFLSGERARDVIAKACTCEGVITHSEKKFLSPRVAIATGGLSYPETGSRGDGYEMAGHLGHTIVALKPALVPVLVKEQCVRGWQGISLRDVDLAVFAAGKKIAHVRGDMLFAHFGLSGPIVLDISADVYDALQRTDDVQLSINMKPDLDHAALEAALTRECKAHSEKRLKNILKSFLPQHMVERFLEMCHVDQEKGVRALTFPERKKIVNALHDFRLIARGVMPVAHGIVTRGGVSTKEINPKTMESKLVKGLFFAGEVIDIDAKSGGYNMQAAFSTGWVCGNNI